MKKKYPEPFKRDRSPGERDAETSILTFAEYAAPYFVWAKDQDRPTCPHARRILDEGKSIGRTHLHQCRSLLERHILTDRFFSALRMTQLRRRDILELRDRLRDQGVKVNTANKSIAAVKIVLAEAFFRNDIDDDPGAGVGEVKYKKAERGVLLQTHPHEACG